MADTKTAATDVRLPYEGYETSVDAAAESLFDALASDPEFQEGQAEDEDERTAESDEEAAEEAEPDDDESDDDAGESDEEDEDADEDEESEATGDAGKEDDDPLAAKEKSLQADYTRKTMALAEQRKALEGEVQQARVAREKYAEGLEQLQKTLERLRPAQPDWDKLRKENPGEFAAQWAEHERLSKAEQEVAAERQRLDAERAQEETANLSTYLEGQKAALLEAIPEWKDPEAAGKEKAALVEFAKGLGYTDEDLGQVYDHRLILILRKAQKYDELASKGKSQIREKRKTAKVLKPGGRDTAPKPGKKTQAKRAMDKLRQTGRTDDAAAAILSMLGDDD